MAKRKGARTDFYAMRKREILLSQPPTEYLTLYDAALLTRLSPWTLRTYIKRGELQCIRIGRRVLVSREALKAWMERHTQQQPQRA